MAREKEPNIQTPFLSNNMKAAYDWFMKKTYELTYEQSLTVAKEAAATINYAPTPEGYGSGSVPHRIDKDLWPQERYSVHLAATSASNTFVHLKPLVDVYTDARQAIALYLVMKIMYQELDASGYTFFGKGSAVKRGPGRPPLSPEERERREADKALANANAQQRFRDRTKAAKTNPQIDILKERVDSIKNARRIAVAEFDFQLSTAQAELAAEQIKFHQK